MPASNRSKNTPLWRTNAGDVLADLYRLDSDSEEHYVTLSPIELSLILRTIEALRENRCPICSSQMCNYELICKECFEERQGSS